ncbi:MAG: hypothetical protein LBI96_00385 [Odoribacteraceae bacterium]|jgi:tRNA threonylcarbamoyladenosine biosynthesis protein TsaB|nr:hypothetical protein [Odoribacteraceae bacterium]
MLTLGISTSAGQLAMALGEDGKLLRDLVALPTPGGAELGNRLHHGLTTNGLNVRDIGAILVDVGPGGTGRVRTGVAFANALGYALGVAVRPVSSVELAGAYAWDRHQQPVIHIVKSIKGNVYAGVARGGQSVAVEYGRLEEILPRLTSEAGDTYVVTGQFRDEALRWSRQQERVTLVDSGSDYGDARLLVEHPEYFTARPLAFPEYARPITEQTL